MVNIRINTERLLIRNPAHKDFPDWHRLLSDPKTMYYLRQDILTRNEKESRDNLDMAISEITNPNRKMYFLAIEEGCSGKFVGSIGYTVTDSTPMGKHVHLGYFILPEFHGKGITTEACAGLICFAFEQGGVYRIGTGAFSQNIASIRVMQKSGMTYEGTLRQTRYFEKFGFMDMAYYSVLRDEYFDICKGELRSCK